jgi:AmmeMemoRadiSam system protein B
MDDAMRKASVQGQFYPKECAKVKTYFKAFNHTFDTMNIPHHMKSIIPRAIIVPHAGYIYSGFTANFAYRFLKQAKVKRIIVIGPSHYHYFKGISGSYYEHYETPCGPLEIDSSYLFALAKQFNIGFKPTAHKKEHSTEVQMPFLEHYFSKTKVIELIYGEISPKILANLMIALLNNKDNALVISSDLSHFYTLKKAQSHDRKCLQGVDTLDLNLLNNGCEACGLTGIQSIILAAKHLNLSSKLLDYRTSANVSQDTTSVVGYMSAMFY